MSVTCAPSATLAGGALTVAVGAVVSVVAAAATSPVSSVAGWLPRSANRLTVACCMLRSAAVPSGFESSSPHDHCTVPALNTRAPLGALYMVRLWVAVPPCLTVLP